MEKRSLSYIFTFFLITLLAIASISASLEIKKGTVSSLAIKDLNKPAIFNLEITNLADTDNFNIYSTVGLAIEPNETFQILAGETKTIQIKVYPSLPISRSPEYYSFEYKIKAASSGNLEKDDLAISIVNLKDAFEFYIDPINPDSETATVHFNNKYGGNLENIHLEFSSVFFSESKDFSLSNFEKKQLEVKLDKEKIKELLAGPYIVNAKVKVGDVSGDTSTVLNFEEKSGITTTQSIEGFFARRLEIEKLNKGNMNTQVNVVVSKDLISALFTTVNLDPTRKEFTGLKLNYIYDKQLAPGESLKVVAKTNWWILILIIIAIIIIWYCVDKYLRNKIVIGKSISLVRTKGGEFALRVSLKVKARDYVERIRLIDRLPPMVKVFDGYGALPERVDEKNRRLEWNIQALGKGEERIFNYIIYSKIGMVGRFELPRAEAIYEFEGKLKEASSNDAFFKNEPVKLN